MAGSRSTKTFRISPYKINMFLTCAQKYKYEYIDGLREKYGKPKPYFTMGAHVHRALKRLFDEYAPKDRTKETIEALLREEWRKNRKGFQGPEDEKFWGELAILMLKQFVEQEDMEVTPLHTEDFQKQELLNGVECIGVIDRIDENKDGSVTIIDYKTSRQVPLEMKNTEERQVKTYAWIIEHALNKPVKEVTLHYLVNNTKLTKQITPSHLTEIEQELRDISTKMKEEKAFQPTANPGCKTCDYQEICPLFQKNTQDST